MVHTREEHRQLSRRESRKPRGLIPARSLPLDFHTFCAVHVVAFSVGGVILGVGGRGRFEVLRVLGEFHSLGLGPGLVAELDQCHHHGQPQAPHKDVEHASHIAQAQSTRLVLRETSQAVSSAGSSTQTQIDTQTTGCFALALAAIATLMVFSAQCPQSCALPPSPAMTALSFSLCWLDLPGSKEGFGHFPRPLVSQARLPVAEHPWQQRHWGKLCQGLHPTAAFTEGHDKTRKRQTTTHLGLVNAGKILEMLLNLTTFFQQLGEKTHNTLERWSVI